MNTRVRKKFKKDPLTLEKLLSGNRFRRLCQKSQHITQANSLLQNMLPEALIGQCVLTHYDAQTLTITTPSANVATRLFYLKPELISNLRYYDPLSTLTNIKIKVRPH